MAQDAELQVLRAAKGVDQLALFVPRDGIDREVAARQVLLQRDIRCGEHGEALVAAPGLALGARERIFLIGLRMQEDREILADRAESQPHHLLGIAAYHHVVMVLDRQAKQLVSHRAAYAIDLHTGCGSNAAMTSVSATRSRDPLLERGQRQHGVRVLAAHRVELDLIGAEPQHDRRVHGVGDAEPAEQERPGRRRSGCGSRPTCAGCARSHPPPRRCGRGPETGRGSSCSCWSAGAGSRHASPRSTERATARAAGAAGHSSSSGWRSARYSQMASESQIGQIAIQQARHFAGG